VLFALLLAPLVAAAMLHSAFTQLINNPTKATLAEWKIESPLVLPSTPIRYPPSHIHLELQATEATKALSALATSRRNLVQLFTLCSFVLLVQLAWSRRHEVRSSLAVSPSGIATPVGTSVTGISGDERSLSGSGINGTYWLKRGELKRNVSVIGMAFLVTAGCLVVKIATAYIEHGVWSGMSPPLSIASV
jgi:dolichol kinase